MGRTTSRWYLALSLFGCLGAHAAAPVWAIHGAHNTVYLAGSVHALAQNDSALPAAFDRAYRDSTRVVMEIDLAKLDPVEAGSWMAEHGTLPAGTHLRSLVGEQTYARVTTAATQFGFPIIALDHQTPWLVGIELTEHAYEHAGYSGERGVEEQLVTRLQADGKASAGLETVQEQLKGLAELSDEDQVRLLEQSLDDLKDLQGEMRDVVAAWRRGDASRLAALLSSEYEAFPALYRPLVTVRNEHWLPQIEALLKGSDNVMVVVGSLHLVGKGGLLELLHRDGYTATQLN